MIFQLCSVLTDNLATSRVYSSTDNSTAILFKDILGAFNDLMIILQLTFELQSLLAYKLILQLPYFAYTSTDNHLPSELTRQGLQPISIITQFSLVSRTYSSTNTFQMTFRVLSLLRFQLYSAFAY